MMKQSKARGRRYNNIESIKDKEREDLKNRHKYIQTMRKQRRGKKERNHNRLPGKRAAGATERNRKVMEGKQSMEEEGQDQQDEYDMKLHESRRTEIA